MTDWLITNAQLVNEGRRFHADLRMRNGRIEPIDACRAAGVSRANYGFCFGAAT